MSISQAVVTPSNMELTPQRVSFKKPGGSSFVDLGGTLGNVAISIMYKKTTLMADQFGKTPIDARVSGVDFKIVTELTEIKKIATIWPILWPNATAVAGGTGFVGQTAVDFNHAIGADSYAKSGALLLHPISFSDADLTNDYNFYKVCSNEEIQLDYSPDGQLKAKITWTVFPDLSKSPVSFFRFGDPALIP